MRSRIVQPHDALLIPRARVPLLRLRTSAIHGNMHVDVCAESSEAAGASHAPERAAAWAARAAAENRTLRSTVLFLKALLGQHSLGDASLGGVSGHCLANLVVAHARAKPHLQTHGDALLSFLRLYGFDFNFETTCVTAGADAPFCSTEEALRSGWPSSTRAGRCRLRVRDPVRPTADVGAPTTRTDEVASLFRATFSTLMGQAAPFARASDTYGWPLLSTVLALDRRGLPLPPASGGREDGKWGRKPMRRL